jgi:acyl carrier protein
MIDKILTVYIIYYDYSGNVVDNCTLLHLDQDYLYSAILRHSVKTWAMCKVFENSKEFIQILKEENMNKSVDVLINEIINDTFKLNITVTRESKLEDLGIDSLEAFNMLYHIENNFNIRFDNKFLPKTVDDIVQEVERLKNVSKNNSSTNS